MEAATENMKSQLKLEEIQGRGRSLISTRPIKAGEIILRDTLILLYSTLSLSTTPTTTNTHFCSRCFKTLNPLSNLPKCPSCQTHYFCSQSCLSTAAASSHTQWVCLSLANLLKVSSFIVNESVERHVQARFLIQAYNLAMVDSSLFSGLMYLQGEVDKESIEVGQFLNSVLSGVCPGFSNGVAFSVEVTARLLVIDKVNAFGLMEPYEEGRERKVRAYGIYPNASFFNHDCLPNACRFDYIDSDGNDRSKTDIIVRMIHDVPAGREICISYFPVNWDYATRQKRLLEDYGFTCECDRCKVEANWSDHENEDGGEDEAMDDDDEEAMDVALEDTEENGGDDFPHEYFFLRYMCNREGCSGTLAPLPPAGDVPSSLLECNVCGLIKHDEMAGDVGDGGQSSLSMDH